MAPAKSNHDLAVADAAQQVQIDDIKEALAGLPLTLWKIAGLIVSVCGLLLTIGGILLGIWLHTQDQRFSVGEKRFERIEASVADIARNLSDTKADIAVIKAQSTPIESFRERLRLLESANAELRVEIKRLQEDKMN